MFVFAPHVSYSHCKHRLLTDYNFFFSNQKQHDLLLCDCEIVKKKRAERFVTYMSTQRTNNTSCPLNQWFPTCPHPPQRAPKIAGCAQQLSNYNTSTGLLKVCVSVKYIKHCFYTPGYVGLTHGQGLVYFKKPRKKHLQLYNTAD